MPNLNKPAGLTPVKNLNGADWDGRGNVYSVATGYGSILAPGDPVTLSGTADATGKYPGIVRHTPGAGLIGAIVAIGINPNGPFINQADLTQMQKAASAVGVYYALVADDPAIIFEVQEDAVGGALAIADVGLNCNLIYADPPGLYSKSGVLLDSSTKANTATLDCKILRLVPRVDNELGTYAKWWVTINYHRLAPNTQGV